MGAAAVPLIVFTALWAVVGIVLPFVVPKGPNRGILQVVLMLTAATCWLLFVWPLLAVSTLSKFISSSCGRELVKHEWKGWMSTVSVTLTIGYLSSVYVWNLLRLCLVNSQYQHAADSWLCCYMAQMNPLIGPKLSNTTILLMAKYWGNGLTP